MSIPFFLPNYFRRIAKRNGIETYTDINRNLKNDEAILNTKV